MSAPKNITKIVAYYRLSKPKKGKNKEETIRDAYGLEDQRQEVARIAAEFNAPIIGEFTEIVTGTNKKVRRVELDKAISMAQTRKATLVIGKQDRLARNARFILDLLDDGVDFMCADRPQQSKLEVQFRAIIDEEEADRISERTKRSHAIAKAKGVKLGSARPEHWKGREHLRGFKQATKASAIARTERVKKAYRYVIDKICELQAEGASLWTIADKLNELGYTTISGKPFHDVAVRRVLTYFDKTSKPARPGNSVCAKCGRPFRLSWAQRRQQEAGRSVLCLEDRCIKDMKWSTASDVIRGMEGKSFAEMAAALNFMGLKTPRGKPFDDINIRYVAKILGLVPA